MTQTLTDRKRTLIFINILISCIATSMLSTALTTALPQIIPDLNIDVTTGQWLTSGYSLAMGIMMPLTAFLITRFPTRNLYLSAIGIFIAGSLICACSHGFAIMMFGRILQASGNGILTSMAQVVLLSIYPSEKRGTIMGWYGLSVGAAPVLAPALAGILIDTVGWRMIFHVATIIMIISLIYAIFVFGNVLETRTQAFDLISFLISAIAFGGLTLGVGNIGSYGLFGLPCLLPLAGGIASFILFVYRQLHLDDPFLEFRILKYPVYTISVIGSMLLYFVMMGSSVILPLYVQSILGHPATISAFVSMPGSLVMTFVNPCAGKLYDRFGMKPLLFGGSIAMLLSNLAMTTVTMETSLILPAIYNMIRCASIGCLMMPLVTWGISGIDKRYTAHGTALLTSFRTIAGAMGAAIFVSIMTSVGKSSVSTYGANAAIHGLNMTFLAMSLCTLILVALSVIVKIKWKNTL